MYNIINFYEMKIYKYLFVFFIGFLSCSQKNTKNSSTIKQKIKGNWSVENFEGNQRVRSFVFSFEDSTCSYLYPWGTYFKYWIKDDTINIKKRISNSKNNINKDQLIYQFLIDSVSVKELILKPITDKTKAFFKDYKNKKPDIIQLTKIEEKYNYEIERIGFYSSICYGTCPSMYLEIDKLGNVLFKGRSHTEKEGLYSGKLSEIEFEIIKSHINGISLNKLEKMYSTNWTDDQTCGILIKTKNNAYESSVYGFDQEPIELRMFFHKLMELYKNTALKKDSTILQNFQLNEFEYNRFPPPPIQETE